MKRLTLLLLALTFLVTGCSTRTKLTGFGIRLEGLALAPDGSGDLVMSVRYINENIVPIAADSTEQRLRLAGREIGFVKSTTPVGLPPTATQPAQVRLTPSAPAALQAILAAGNLAAVPYQLELRLNFEDVADKYRADAVAQGTVDLTALAR